MLFGPSVKPAGCLRLQIQVGKTRESEEVMKHSQLSLKARPPNIEKMCLHASQTTILSTLLFCKPNYALMVKKKKSPHPQIFIEKISNCSSSIQWKKNNLHVSRVCADYISEKRPSPGLMQGPHYSQTEGFCLFFFIMSVEAVKIILISMSWWSVKSWKQSRNYKLNVPRFILVRKH